VRRTTAAVGLPTLRLVRVAAGPWRLGGLQPGEWLEPPRPLEASEKIRQYLADPTSPPHRPMRWTPHVTVAAIAEREGALLFVEEAIQGRSCSTSPPATGRRTSR